MAQLQIPAVQSFNLYGESSNTSQRWEKWKKHLSKMGEMEEILWIFHHRLCHRRQWQKEESYFFTREKIFEIKGIATTKHLPHYTK